MAQLEEQQHVRPCRCGQGTIEWTFYSPTTFFQSGYEGPRTLNCETCSKDWVLADGGLIRLQRREHLAAYTEASKRSRDAVAALRRDAIAPTVTALHARAKAGGRRAADWYPVLRELIPEAVGASLSEFNQRRAGASLLEWLEVTVGATNVERLASRLGLAIPTTALVRAQAEAESAKREAQQCLHDSTWQS
jgi:hypothetical protein